MDRRTFILGLGAAASVSMSGCVGLLHQRCDTAPCSPVLLSQLADLADPHFVDYAQGLSVPTLYTALQQKGVISAGHGINFENLHTLARAEPIVVYQEAYYTRTELDLYALAHLISKT